MGTKDNGIIFVAGIHINDLDFAAPIGGSIVTYNNVAINRDHLILKDYMRHIEVNMYADLYKHNDVLRFNGINWGKGQFENYSAIGNYIVYISKSKGIAIDKIADLYKMPKHTRKNILKGGYFD